MEFDNETLTQNLAICLIPPRMHPGIIRWIQYGIIPGSFLTAIIENNLKEAVYMADDENILKLVAYVRFFYMNAPASCWGSKEKVQKWAKKGGIEGRDEFILKEITLESIAEEENSDGE